VKHRPETHGIAVLLTMRLSPHPEERPRRQVLRSLRKLGYGPRLDGCGHQTG